VGAGFWILMLIMFGIGTTAALFQDKIKEEKRQEDKKHLESLFDRMKNDDGNDNGGDNE